MNNIKTSVATDVWVMMDVAGLNAAQRLVLMAILTSPERSVIGIFPISEKALANRTALNIKTVKTALIELESQNFILRDGNEILVRIFFISNPPANGNTYKMYYRDLNAIMSENLLDVMICECEHYFTYTFAAALLDCKFHRKTEKKWSDDLLEKARHYGEKNNP